MLPLIVDLSSNPDRIVVALGLNFNPDDLLRQEGAESQVKIDPQVKMLPSSPAKAPVPQMVMAAPIAAAPIADDYYPKDRPYQRRD